MLNVEKTMRGTNNKGDLIFPRLYASTLPGSLASVKFALTRQWVSHSGSYTYRANVEEINIIESTRVEIGSASHTKLVESVRKRKDISDDRSTV